MHCPRCNQPVHSRSWRHRDGHTDTRHVCRNHLCRYRWQERRDATDAQVAAMRAEIPRFSTRLQAAKRANRETNAFVRDSVLSTAVGAGLDALADLYGCKRQQGEPDDALRKRRTLKFSPYGALTIKGQAAPKSRPNPMPHIAHILDLSAHDISLAGVYVGPGDGLHIHLRGAYYEGQSLLCQCGMGGRQQVNIVQISPQSDGTVMARFRVKCLGCDTTQYSYNAVSVTELPKVGASAPKPPRPVKVGDVLLNEVGQSARKVLGVERGRLLLCYCGHGVDESVATASYLLDDALRLGWTHADGAAIAVETKHREVMPGYVLRDYDGEGWRVDAFDGERYRLQSTGRPIDCLITLDGMRAEGWTFADTGEKV